MVGPTSSRTSTFCLVYFTQRSETCNASHKAFATKLLFKINFQFSCKFSILMEMPQNWLFTGYSPHSSPNSSRHISYWANLRESATRINQNGKHGRIFQEGEGSMEGRNQVKVGRGLWDGEGAPLTICQPSQRQAHSGSPQVPSTQLYQQRTSWCFYHWVPWMYQNLKFWLHLCGSLKHFNKK